MPFSRYQIRNEFSLADPELYKSADKDDPEALLEGVAMAGLVGVLRQLGDLAEFAAEIFHGLHEEVMVTAARGHGLLGRVQQLESDFPSIERAFLSQTSHSPFLSSSGIGWHPDLKTEQHLITRGDLPRFIMDSYEECRGPPRLFLLDKFDIAGAGACLKRYTDPSFFEVEALSYVTTTVEALKNKKVHKAKNKGSQWKNEETPEVFQPSHVKLHQLLLEERVQNGATEPARRVKLKKRHIKLPYDTESGKGYMEKLLSSPPEDKLVHEVPVGASSLSSPTVSFGGPALETHKVGIIDAPMAGDNGLPYDSPSVDKAVTKEHINTVPEIIHVSSGSDLPTSNIELEGGEVYSVDENVEEKHISVDNDGKVDGYQSDDVASDAENYLDALATMESEIETDVEHRANSDQCRKQETDSDANIDQLQSHLSDSQYASDDESSEIRKKLTSFTYSDTASTSADNMSPCGVNSPQAFAGTEIPFRPRVSPNPGSVNPIEVSDVSSHRSADNLALPVDQGANFKENSSKESDLSELSSNSISELADRHSSTIDDPSSSSIIENARYEIENEDHNSNSTLVISHVEKLDICDSNVKPDTCSIPKAQLTDELLESKSDPADAGGLHSSEDETELHDRETVSVDSKNTVKTADDRKRDNTLPTVSVSDHVDRIESEGLSTYEDETQLHDRETISVETADDRSREDSLLTLEVEKEPEFVRYETETVIDVVSISDLVDRQENDGLSTYGDTKFEGREVKSVDLETQAATFAVPIPSDVDKNEDNNLSTLEVPCENGLVNHELEVIQSSNKSVENEESSEQSVVSPELGKFPPYYNSSNVQFLDSIQNSYPGTSGNVNDEVDNLSAKKELTEIISPELDYIPSVVSDHLNIQCVDSIPTHPNTNGDENKNEIESPSADLEILQEGSILIRQTDQNGLQKDVSPHVDYQPVSGLPNDHANAQFLDSPPNDASNQDVESIPHNHSIPLEENVDQPHIQSLQVEIMDPQNCADTHSEPYTVNHESYPLKQVKENIGESIPELSLLSSDKNLTNNEYPSAPAFSGFDMLPQVAPINLEETPPLPPLPPMQWRMGKLQDDSMVSKPDDGQHIINHFPPAFPQIASHPSLDQMENEGNENSENDYQDAEGSSQGLPKESSVHTEEDGNLVKASEINVKFTEQTVSQPPFFREQSKNVSTSGREIILPSSTSSLPEVDDEGPKGIRPMKIQRPRTPLIDAVAAHDKSMLRKVSERPMPPIPKDEERDTFLEQIRAKSVNLKPAVQTRPSIQGPSTNLRVAAILEKANAIRHAFAGSDDDEDGWSDS